jgi:hypothetical protein
MKTTSLTRTLLRIVPLACLVFMVGCATMAPEHLSLTMDQTVKWKKGFEHGGRGQAYIVEFVPEGETVDNWSKMITVQNFTMKDVPNSSTPETLMNEVKAKMQSRCPGVTWNVIQKGESEILYEWRIENCSPNPDQHEVAKIMDGAVNRFVVHYVSKVKMLPEDERTDWIKRLQDAKIEAR